jgi:hypothetical protein
MPSWLSGYPYFMAQQKKAFSVALLGIGAVAAAMVVFYYLQNHFRKPEGAEEGAVVSEEETQVLQPQEGRSDFAGLYAATDGVMEAAGKRITSFSVTNTDGVLVGTVKIDTIGSDEGSSMNCMDVRIEGKEFFLKCQGNEGMISLNGAWTKDEASGAVAVAGKVLWSQNGNLLLDVSRNFQLLRN